MVAYMHNGSIVDLDSLDWLLTSDGRIGAMLKMGVLCTASPILA